MGDDQQSGGSQASGYEQHLGKASAILGGHGPSDFPELVDAQEHLLAAREADMVGGDGSNAAPLSEAVELIEQIVLREVEDAEAAFARLRNLVGDAGGELETSSTSDAEPGDPPAAVEESASVSEDVAASTDEASPPSAGEIDEELLGQWLSGCEAMLAELGAEVVEIEQADDPSELQAEISRKIHTLKGECGVLGLGAAQQLSHDLESLVADKGPEAYPVEAVLRFVDWMTSYASQLQSDPYGAPPDAAPVREAMNAGAASSPSQAAESTPAADASEEAEMPDANEPVEMDTSLVQGEGAAEFCCEAREHLASAEEALLLLDEDPTELEAVNTVFRSFHTMKGVAGFMNLAPVAELAHHAETLLDAARTSKLVLDANRLSALLKSCDILSQLVGHLEGGALPIKGDFAACVKWLEQALTGEGEPPKMAPATPRPASGNTAAPDANPDAPSADGPKTPEPADAAPGQQAAGGKRSGAPRGRADQTVKVSTGRMDGLVDIVGELVIAQQMILQDPLVQGIDQPRFQKNLTHVSKIVRDLQETAMSLRMVTLKTTFQKMARLVRSVSQQTGKPIRFAMEGEDTELDRNVVDEIADPLVHMIRNACDHGIESVEDRRATDKPEHGQVTIRAYHQSGSIVIEIADDGRGLNREKLLKKATERGLIPPDRDTDDMKDSEVFALIFAPGFSTAEAVTDISGRGVGMDVVRKNIEALRGKVEIQSRLGEGSTFRMRLPLTMAIIDGMIVRVGGQRFVLPTLSIERSFRPQAENLHTVIGKGEMASLRGSLIPYYRMSEVFGLGEQQQSVEDSILIVLESNASRFGILVDEILGQQQVVIKSLSDVVAPIRGVSGGAILGDGRVALILDVAGIEAEATDTTRERAQAS